MSVLLSRDVAIIHALERYRRGMGLLKRILLLIAFWVQVPKTSNCYTPCSPSPD